MNLHHIALSWASFSWLFPTPILWFGPFLNLLSLSSRAFAAALRLRRSWRSSSSATMLLKSALSAGVNNGSSAKSRAFTCVDGRTTKRASVRKGKTKSRLGLQWKDTYVFDYVSEGRSERKGLLNDVEGQHEKRTFWDEKKSKHFPGQTQIRTQGGVGTRPLVPKQQVTGNASPGEREGLLLQPNFDSDTNLSTNLDVWKHSEHNYFVSRMGPTTPKNKLFLKWPNAQGFQWIHGTLIQFLKKTLWPFFGALLSVLEFSLQWSFGSLAHWDR